MGLLQIVLISLATAMVAGWGNFQSYNLEERDLDFRDVDLNKLVSKLPLEQQKTVNGSILYDPNWESLDARPLPSWYDEAKIGIFIHWGVFSVPAVRTEWFWNVWKRGNSNECEMYVLNNFKPNFTYQEFAPDFTAEFYDPFAWANLFARSGAKYVVLTSKHHEGYTLWPSRYSWSWNSMDVGSKRDLLGDLATAIRENTTLKFGLYHSLYEWYNPQWMRDFANNFTTTEFVDNKITPSLYELVNTYEPEIFWSDGEWDAPSEYWHAQEFLAWLYNTSPVKDTVVTNDRWGGDTLCKHGGYYTCADRYNPGVLQPHKWENCMTLDKSWGYRKNANIEDYMTPEKLIQTIVESVSCGGNVLVNVGPTKEGIISPVQQERLLQMGEWLGINGEAIYESVPWLYQNDTVTPDVWYTTNKNETKVYAVLINWSQEVNLGAVEMQTVSAVRMLGAEGMLLWSGAEVGINVILPALDKVDSKWAWTLVIEKV